MNASTSEVVVALSGGVDSCFAAAALKESGWKVHGVHFILPAGSETANEKIGKVRATADFLRIPLEVVDLTNVFTRKIVNPFIEAYLGGLTPNPCVSCNPGLKFEFLLRHADELGVRFVATGHYAQAERSEGRPFIRLKKGRDEGKEQSYFLQRLTQRHLTRAIFPLANLKKTDVRARSRKRALPVHSAPESQEICFLPKNDYRLFIEEKRGNEANRPGDILDARGEAVGKHAGAHRYTIGQRHGLGIASPRPYYVMEIRPEANEVVVGRREELFSREVEAEAFSWVDGRPPEAPNGIQGQIRYRHRPAPGRLEIVAPDRVRFVFDEPQWAITPGQALACYEGDALLGGGWIVKRRAGGRTE